MKAGSLLLPGCWDFAVMTLAAGFIVFLYRYENLAKLVRTAKAIAFRFGVLGQTPEISLLEKNYRVTPITAVRIHGHRRRKCR